MLCKLLGDLLRLSSSGFSEQIQIDFETFFAAISSPQSRLHARHIFDINLKTFVFIWQTIFLSAKKKKFHWRNENIECFPPWKWSTAALNGEVWSTERKYLITLEQLLSVHWRFT